MHSYGHHTSNHRVPWGFYPLTYLDGDRQCHRRHRIEHQKKSYKTKRHFVFKKKKKKVAGDFDTTQPHVIRKEHLRTHALSDLLQGNRIHLWKLDWQQEITEELQENSGSSTLFIPLCPSTTFMHTVSKHGFWKVPMFSTFPQRHRREARLS